MPKYANGHPGFMPKYANGHPRFKSLECKTRHMMLFTFYKLCPSPCGAAHRLGHQQRYNYARRPKDLQETSVGIGRV